MSSVYQASQRFSTGQTCPVSGVYKWDGYTDGSRFPAPTAQERLIPLAKGETFPPVRSSKKAAYWVLQRQG